VIIDINTYTRTLRIFNNSEFEEKHKRDDKGQFVTKGTEEIRKKDDLHRTRPESVEELYGKEFFGFKGKAAIYKLMEEREGYIKGAFTRPDIGDIDLVWGWSKGKKGAGLFHIIERRQETGQDVNLILDELEDVIQNGKKISTDDYLAFERNNKKAIVSVEFKGNKVHYIVTAYEIYK